MAALVARDYQAEAVASLWHYFETRTVGNPVVAMPTGTGKAFVIALFLQQVFARYAGQKILVVTHVKELVAQNYAEFLELWPTAPAGIYSAGLNRKDTAQRITFCGIASIAKAIEAFGHVDLMMVDECHLMSQDDESMYLTVIKALMAVNPNLRIIGLTATPWRAGQGKITDDGIFTDICFDVTDMHSFNRFITEGYLSPLIPFQTEASYDLSGVHMRGGDYKQNELNEAFAKDEITFAAVQETVRKASGRNHWLVFASGIENTVKVTEMLQYVGISARCVHSKMTDKVRDQNIADWKAGKFTAMVNNGILTTGVNFKAIDLIVMLRGTMSTVLWVQMLGRGTRPLYAPGFDLTTRTGRLAAIQASGKVNCMVLDFAGNTQRLGPINDPVIPRKRGEKTGEVPIKICPAADCGMFNHVSARFCGGEPFKTDMGCGHKFEFKSLLGTTASDAVLIKVSDEPVIKEYRVSHVTYNAHRKPGKPQCLCVTYWCGPQNFKEFILFEHDGWGQRKAKRWWNERSRVEVPATTQDAITLLGTLTPPTDIKVWVNAKPYPVVHEVSFTGAFAKPIVGDEVPF